MTRRADWVTRILGTAVLLSVFAAAPAHATPIVVATVAPSGSLFHYSYAITFNQQPADEIAILNIQLLEGDTLTNPTIPAGFQMVYDPGAGVGLLTFLPGTLPFPLTGTVSGFAFDSPHRAAPTTFQAETIFGSFQSGPTVGPLGPASPIPEPVTGVLLAIGLGALGGRRAIRRRLGARS